MSDDPTDQLDPRLFEALDTYLQTPPAGRGPLRVDLIERRPELAGLMDCVDRLESLALPLAAAVAGESVAGESPDASGDTISWGAAPRDSGPKPYPSESGSSVGQPAPPGRGRSEEIRPRRDGLAFPQSFGKYELLAEIGRGGGVVDSERQERPREDR
jgi:hypothetical protein